MNIDLTDDKLIQKDIAEKSFPEEKLLVKAAINFLMGSQKGDCFEIEIDLSESEAKKALFNAGIITETIRVDDQLLIYIKDYSLEKLKLTGNRELFL